MKVVIPGSSTALLVFVYHGIRLAMEFRIVRVERTNQEFVATLLEVCGNLFHSNLKAYLIRL
jgi:hypothetical protein